MHKIKRNIFRKARPLFQTIQIKYTLSQFAARDNRSKMQGVAKLRTQILRAKKNWQLLINLSLRTLWTPVAL